MYKANYEITNMGGVFVLIVTNVDTGLCTNYDLIIINGIYIVTDSLTELQFAVLVTEEGIRLYEAYIYANQVAVRYQNQFVTVAYCNVQGGYIFSDMINRVSRITTIQCKSTE